MAELAIPVIAFGALYICSNKEKQDKNNTQENKEGFTIKGETNYTDMKPIEPVVNYPSQSKVSQHNPNNYLNSNSATDKYFDPSQLNNSRVNNINNGIQTMSGDVVNQSEFKHNNMVPFFGSKIRGRGGDFNSSQSILDNKQGNGSLINKKEEIAPLFKPEENSHFTHGAPNSNNFYQSRINTSNKMSNVKPWAEEQVGPGLNNGYSIQGSGGFNSGMESRDSWLPKTVDQLRVATNPKQSFGLDSHQGPAMAPVVERGLQGKMEKHLPDTFYINNPDRWFTTTGLEKGETQRATQVDRETQRMTTSCQYEGGAHVQGQSAIYSKQNYQEPKKECLPTNPITNLNGTNNVPASSRDYGNGSYNILANNRNTTDTGFFGLVSGTVNAMVSPVMDVLRPSRKENVIGNLRVTGDAKSSVPASYILNPADRAPTTIKEMTENSSGNLFLTGKQDGGYLAAKHQAVLNQRDTTNVSNMGAVSGSVTGEGGVSHVATDNQVNNASKTDLLQTHPNQGGTQMFNQYMNVQVDKNENDLVNNYTYTPHLPFSAPSADTMGKMQMPKVNTCQTDERMKPDILNAFKNNPYTQSLHSI